MFRQTPPRNPIVLILTGHAKKKGRQVTICSNSGTIFHRDLRIAKAILGVLIIRQHHFTFKILL